MACLEIIFICVLTLCLPDHFGHLYLRRIFIDQTEFNQILKTKIIKMLKVLKVKPCPFAELSTVP
jgi:hypothetical protein